MIEREATIVNQEGLHARPAAKIVRLASTFDSEIELFKDGVAVNGTVSRDRTARDRFAADSQGWTIVAALETKLATVLDRANKDSMNLYAEALCKRLGREVSGEPGSWAVVIREGVFGSMPANPDLTREQVAALVQHLRELRGEAAPSSASR